MIKVSYFRSIWILLRNALHRNVWYTVVQMPPDALMEVQKGRSLVFSDVALFLDGSFSNCKLSPSHHCHTKYLPPQTKETNRFHLWASNTAIEGIPIETVSRRSSHAKQQFNLLAGCRAHATRKMKCVHNQLRNVKVLVRLWRPPYTTTTTTTTTTRQQQCISCERSRRSYFYLGFGSHCFFGATCDFSSSARTGRLDNIESLPKTDVADDIMFCFFASHTGFGLET